MQETFKNNGITGYYHTDAVFPDSNAEMMLSAFHFFRVFFFARVNKTARLDFDSLINNALSIIKFDFSQN